MPRITDKKLEKLKKYEIAYKECIEKSRKQRSKSRKKKIDKSPPKSSIRESIKKPLNEYQKFVQIESQEPKYKGMSSKKRLTEISKKWKNKKNIQKSPEKKVKDPTGGARLNSGDRLARGYAARSISAVAANNEKKVKDPTRLSRSPLGPPPEGTQPGGAKLRRAATPRGASLRDQSAVDKGKKVKEDKGKKVNNKKLSI